MFAFIRKREFKNKKRRRKDSIGTLNFNNKSSNRFVIENLQNVQKN